MKCVCGHSKRSHRGGTDYPDLWAEGNVGSCQMTYCPCSEFQNPDAPPRPQEGPAVRALRVLDEEAVRAGPEGLPPRGGPVAVPAVRVGDGRAPPGLADLSPQVGLADLSGEEGRKRATVLHPEPEEESRLWDLIFRPIDPSRSCPLRSFDNRRRRR